MVACDRGFANRAIGLHSRPVGRTQSFVFFVTFVAKNVIGQDVRIRCVDAISKRTGNCAASRGLCVTTTSTFCWR